MSMWDSALAVEVDEHGVRSTFGPFPGMPAAMRFVSEHVADTDRYRHEYIGLADGLFDLPPREQREPLEAALRAAIEREHGALGDGSYGDGLYAHLDLHRPWRLELKPEECWEGGCEHPEDDDGNCTAPPQRELWCRRCTPVYIGGSEFDGHPYDECQVDWPCSPVRALCVSFGVTLTGKALH